MAPVLRSASTVLPADDAVTLRPTRVLSAVSRFGDALGLFRRPFSANEMIRLARRRTGLQDFGEAGLDEALGVLLSSYDAEANLSLFGRMAARWDTLRFLTNLLLLRDAERKNPAILAEPIEAPIFITGMPRSGTSFLHELLAEDRANHVVRCWETIYPKPGANAARRRKTVERQLAGFSKLAPEIRTLHPLTADSPQECSEITAHLFTSLRFDTTHHVPSYRRWLDNQGHAAAYAFHQRFLKHLQHRQGRGRWILKCPDHVFALAAIRAAYPDARFVFLHRDPLEILPSVSRLTEVLRRPFTRHVDRKQIGRQVGERWARGAALLVEAWHDGFRPSSTVVHLGFRSLAQDPVRTVAALYEGFRFKFDGAFEARLRAAATAVAGQQRTRSRLEDYGLDANAERERYRSYAECFGL